MSENIIAVTDQSFESTVLKSSKPVLVDFWAQWCGPCRAVAPVLEEAATQYGDKIQIVKVNVDENNEIPAQFGIRSIPTLLLFKNGSVIGTHIGSLTKSQLVAFIDSHIAD
jgi:thioredoxin 1